MKIILLLLVIASMGCGPVLKIYYGYHKPTPEDKESLTKYLKRKKINADNILVFSDSISHKNKLRKDISGFPEIRVFNKNGILVYYKDTTALCNAPAYEFTESI